MNRPRRTTQARHEVGHTEISRLATWLLLVGALLLTVSVPLIDSVADQAGESPANIFSRFARAATAAPAAGDGESSPMARILASNRSLLAAIDACENGLEEGSAVRAAAPLVRWQLAGWGGVGNEEVFLGRWGWLYFRPGIDYLVGPGFLEPRVLERRRRAGPSWKAPPRPDPRPALLDFRRQLEERGIELVLLPVPPKAAVHPEPLGVDSLPSGALENASFKMLVTQLADSGIEIFDPTPALLATRAAGQPAYLRTDSHWSPQGVDAVARELADHLLQRLRFEAPRQESSRSDLEMRGVGDLLRMLELPPEQTLYAEEAARVPTVEALAGTPEVLVLGDSFSNIYSQSELGWGTAAGLAEQLSHHLGRPVARLAVNGGGASASRRRLAQDLALGRDRLRDVRMVILEAAMRELAVGDWQLVELPALGTAGISGDARRARGIVRAVAAAPKPSETPYPDAIITLRVVLEPDQEEALVYGWGLRDRQRTALAELVPGQSVELSLVPWSSEADRLEPFARIELPGMDVSKAYWLAEPLQ